MLTFKEQLDSLPKEKRALLFYAFENELEQFVELPGSRYIGVNISKIPFLKPEKTLGVWSIGTYHRVNS